MTSSTKRPKSVSQVALEMDSDRNATANIIGMTSAVHKVFGDDDTYGYFLAGLGLGISWYKLDKKQAERLLKIVQTTLQYKPFDVEIMAQEFSRIFEMLELQQGTPINHITMGESDDHRA